MEKHILTVKKTILSHLPDAKIYFFGSRAQKTHQAFSDLDVAIHHKKTIPLETLARIKETLANSNIPFLVDVVDFQRITPSFQNHILSKHGLDL